MVSDVIERPSAGAHPAVAATALTKDFPIPGGTLRAVDAVSFELAQGSSLGIVGESGSGKSTLARMVLRLIEPSSGDLRVDGVDLLSLKGAELRRRRKTMQMVFQNPYGSLLPNLSVVNNIAEPLRIHQVGTPAERRTAATTLMAQVGLAPRYADVYPRGLSGGQQQRVAIARALALEPSLLVCDEPTSALDVSIQAQILALLGELRSTLGFSMIFITHNLGVAQRLTDSIMVMKEGKVVESGTTDGIFADPQDPYTQQLLASTLPVRGPATRFAPAVVAQQELDA